MPNYIVLKQQIFESGEYSIVPIRDEDKYFIMNWRNEQMYHLRQSSLLTREMQEAYFEKIINSLFENLQPDQILFSYLHKEVCVGYGGLVHINWVDKNAEISFLMNTKLESESFEIHWSNFLKLIEHVAFDELSLHKIYTYAFDLRPKLYKILEVNNFVQEARLNQHSYFNNNFIDVLIHAKINR